MVVVRQLVALPADGGRCTRYTDNRRDNFDIYLPNWLARFNNVDVISGGDRYPNFNVYVVTCYA